MIANFSSIKIISYFLVDLLSSYCLCFLWSEWYLDVTSRKRLWTNPSFICFSCKHNIPWLSTIVSIPFLYHFIFLRFSVYMSHIYILHRSFRIFFISFFISLYSLNTLFTKTNSSWLIYESIKGLEIRTSKVSNLSLATLFYHVSSYSFYL